MLGAVPGMSEHFPKPLQHHVELQQQQRFVVWFGSFGIAATLKLEFFEYTLKRKLVRRSFQNKCSDLGQTLIVRDLSFGCTPKSAVAG